MANGDITKEIEYDKIEVVQVLGRYKFARQQRSWKKTQTVLRQSLVGTFHRHMLEPFNSTYTPAVEAVEARS